MASDRALATLALRHFWLPDEEDDEDDSTPWAVWRGQEIAVWDFLPEEWEWRIHQLIDAFNEIRPSRMPPLVYRRMAARPFQEIRSALLARRGITICLDAKLRGHEPSVVAAAGLWGVRNYVIFRAVIRLRPRLIPGEDALCHELMHALTGVKDKPDGAPFPYEEDSCVLGYLDRPGPFDRQLLRWVYRKFGPGR